MCIIAWIRDQGHGGCGPSLEARFPKTSGLVKTRAISMSKAASLFKWPFVTRLLGLGPRTGHRLKSLLVLTLALGLSFLGAGGAWAHAVLLETIPEDSARLEAPPPEVRLRFNEPVVPVAVKVLDQNG